MQKLKYNPRLRLRIAAKLEIVLRAKMKSVPKKGLEKFFQEEYKALRSNQRKYIKNLLLVDWPEHGNKDLLDEYLREIHAMAQTAKAGDRPKVNLGLAFPYLRNFYCSELCVAIMFANQAYDREVSLPFPKLEIRDPDVEEDDDEVWAMFYHVLDEPD
ncbi:hypothetical protein pEaSNUABM22_00221 [Erwinia phage pEa_SNUABM_22]|uniref:Uncharacterized protein n=1 Tax=Erwinia phage pEa_SNUABM_22 TaxID=2869549 RepID=A0AAE9BVE0_9CAUD|nr:hypothetical protein MPK63_gp220 [Erwinia phage pEa_SNUABM_22]UAW96708.1 hypothetical protein pEaSNUABM22_00221 [Erwinia phage pEa_SNUABM_22]